MLGHEPAARQSAAAGRQQYFDVVVFDEASQIEPADAIPAILRGKSIVVAGDDRQLPPTSFFATANPQEEDADTDPARLAVGATSSRSSTR